MNGSTTGVHHEFVKAALPYWYTSATPEQRQRLHRDILAGRLLQVEKVNTLSALKGLREFAKGKLTDALSTHEAFGPGLDVEQDEIWIAQVERRTASTGFVGISGGGPTVTATGYTKTSLLQAALHNYRSDEVQVVRGEHFSSLRRAASGPAIRASAARFMEFCRGLDLGGQYQNHLNRVFHPTAEAVAKGAPTAGNVGQAFDRCARNALHIAAHVALMQGPLKADDYHAVLSACGYDDDRLPAVAVQVSYLTLLGFDLRDVLVFKRADRDGYIVYIPDDHYSVFRRHTSLDELMDWLSLRLGYASYQQFFAGLVDHGQQQRFLVHIKRSLQTFLPRHLGGRPELNLRLQPITNLATDYFSLKAINRIRDEARVMAVPTADQDGAEDAELLKQRREPAMNILSVAGLFVPGVGEIVAGVVGIQLLGEVFAGVAAWRQGETEEALEHLSSVALNVAAFFAVQQAGKVLLPAILSAIKPSGFVDSMLPIKLSNGETRLWTSDLAPFAADVRLPDEVQPTAEGLVTHQGQQYINLEGRLYPVERDTTLNRWRVMPRGSEPLAPLLEHNGAGAWHHEGEDPGAWDSFTSFRRLGGRFAALPASDAGEVMKISGMDESLLSSLHLDNQRPPAALIDALERFELDRQVSTVAGEGEDPAQVFDRLNQRREATDDPGVQLLQRDFPGLPTLSAREVLAHASEQERAGMLATQRIPLAINGRVRSALQTSRLNRALEGFFLHSRALEPDTEKLAVHLLEHLPGWPKDVHIEIHDGLFGGPSTPGSLRIKRGEHGSLFAAVLHALPAESRQAIGFVDPEVDAQALARRISDEASHQRQRSAKLLGMRTIKPGFTGPERLADGRLRYSLSGRGRLSASMRADVERRNLAGDLVRLYPDALNIDRYIADQEALGRTVEQMRQEVRGRMRELLSLQTTLDGWANPVGPDIAITPVQRVVREGVSDAIIGAWRVSSSPLSTMRGLRSLTLRSIDMAELSGLPELPEHYARIGAINLDSVTASPEQIDGFVRRFANVTELSINNVAFTRLPGQLSELEHLSGLSLTGVRGMTFDQSVMDQLVQLRNLRMLDLSENSFGEINRFEHSQLRDLMLRNSQLTQWPQWVDDLSLSSLDISSNEIEHLPLRVIENQGQAAAPLVIHAHGNPLDQSELSQFWDSNNGRFGGSYRVETGELAVLNWEDSSDAGSEAFSDWSWQAGHRNSPSSLTSEPDVSIWLIDESGREAVNASLRGTWQDVEQAGDAEDLLKLIQRLNETPDFKNSHTSLAMDVRDVLAAAARDTALRTRLNAMAYGRLSGPEQTCQDGVRLIFSDIRIAVLEDAALLDEAHYRPGEALLRMVRSLFRLSEVESIATRDITVRSGNVDPAEVRMAYRIGLADELQLPGQPTQMQWARLADVSPQTLRDAGHEVLGREQGTAFVEYAALNNRWADFLRETYVDDFRRLWARCDAQMEALEGLALTNPAEYQRQGEEVANLFQVNEKILLEQLTRNLLDEYF